MKEAEPLHLFEGYGVELEYMIVDRTTLAVAPLADRVLRAQAGRTVNEVEVGALCWSNELVLHVIELKTNGPAPRLAGLADQFQRGIAQINWHLLAAGGQLMPGGMHPWMDPLTETRLWPHGDERLYRAYDRIFGCRGHGWSNLQSAHLNLPFQGDDEFGRLHAAIRLVLPLLPALAASSPLVAGDRPGPLDCRLRAYRENQRRIPQIAGTLIPEAVFDERSYRSRILQPIYAAIAPYDAAGLLQHEWLNSRGAIARFERGSIEIRLLDTQECPRADLAIIELLCAVLKALVDQRWSSYAEQRGWGEELLSGWLSAAIDEGEQARIDDPGYLAQFGFGGARASMQELWQHLAETLRPDLTEQRDAPLAVILNRGTLARRILNRAGTAPSRRRLAELYGMLCDCLLSGRMFDG